MPHETADLDLRHLTAQIVTAYVSSHDIGADALPGLIRAVHDSLATVDVQEEVPAEKPVPAVPPRNQYFLTTSSVLKTGRS